MKITKRQLRRIIKEETQYVLKELSGGHRNQLANMFRARGEDVGAMALYNVMTGPSYNMYTKDEVDAEWGIDSLVEHMSDSEVQEILDNMLAASGATPGEYGSSLSAEEMAWPDDQ